MLYWICPECGRECSPAIRECPACAAAPEEVPAVSGVVLQSSRTSRDFPSPAASLPSVAPREDSVRSSNGTVRENGDSLNSAISPFGDAVPSSAALPAATQPAGETAPPVPQSLALLSSHQSHGDMILQFQDLVPLERVRPRPVKTAKPRSKLPESHPVAPVLPQAAITAAPVAPSESVLCTPDLIRLHEALGPAPGGAIHSPELPEDAVAPVESMPREPLFASAQVTPASGPLVQPAAYDAALVEEALAHQAEAVLEALAPPAPASPITLDTRAVLSEALALQAEALIDEIGARASAEQAAIQALAARFREQPAACLLAAPSEILVAPAGATLQWMRMPRPLIRPCAPPDSGYSLFSGEPQPPTLAGACLPAQLRNFIEEPASLIPAARKPIGFPTWLVSVLVATCLFLLAGTAIQYLASNRDANAASVSAAPQSIPPAPVAAPAPPPPVVHEHPSARFVEVAGVRVVTAPNHKPQLQYIVVNHSASELTGLDIRIAGRSPETPSGTAPLFSVSGAIPSLGAYQSKEIHIDLDGNLRASAIPDWQSLRTEILVTRQ